MARDWNDSVDDRIFTVMLALGSFAFVGLLAGGFAAGFVDALGQFARGIASGFVPPGGVGETVKIGGNALIRLLEIVLY